MSTTVKITYPKERYPEFQHLSPGQVFSIVEMGNTTLWMKLDESGPRAVMLKTGAVVSFHPERPIYRTFNNVRVILEDG